MTRVEKYYRGKKCGLVENKGIRVLLNPLRLEPGTSELRGLQGKEAAGYQPSRAGCRPVIGQGKGLGEGSRSGVGDMLIVCVYEVEQRRSWQERTREGHWNGYGKRRGW